MEWVCWNGNRWDEEVTASARLSPGKWRNAAGEVVCLSGEDEVVRVVDLKLVYTGK